MLRTALYYSIALVLCISSRQALAGADSGYLLDLSLEELMQVEVRSATRTLSSMAQVPASVTVFTRAEVQKMGIDFLYELLNYVPGYQNSRSSDYSNTYFYSARGSDTTGGSKAILLLVDGVPRQDVLSSSASTLSGVLALERIEHIEVMRGPSSALYGSGAFLGVINIVTVKGVNRFSTQLGESDRQQTVASISQPLGVFEFEGFFSHYSDNGQDYLLDDRFSDQLQSTSDPQQIDNIALQLKYGKTSLMLERMEHNAEQFYSANVINNSFNEADYTLNQIALLHQFDWYQVSSELMFSYNKLRREYSAQGSPAGVLQPISDAPLLGDVLDYMDHMQLQWHNDWQLSPDNSIQFGIEQRKERILENSILANYDIDALANGSFPVAYSPNGDIYTPLAYKNDRDIFGLYGQWQTQPLKRTRFTLGTRYDRYQELDDNFSLRLAMVQELSQHQFLKAIYGEAFRAPSLVFLSLIEQPNYLPNPNLRPETVRSSELIWLVQTSHNSFTVSGFYNVLDDHIETTIDSNNRRTEVNGERDYSAGIELETSMQFGSEWLLKASLTEFLRLPDASFQVSEQLASLILNYQHNNWWINLSAYYNSERQMSEMDVANIDSSSVFNAKVGVELDQDITLNLQIKNLTDADAASAPTSPNIFSPVPHRGREISVGFSKDF